MALTFGTLIANLAPSLIYRARHGVNTEYRHAPLPREAEWFGYKMAASLLPIPDHKIDAFSKLRWKFEAETLRSNEGAWAAQGFIANIGYLTLLGLLLYRRKAWQWLEGLSVLHISGILLGTMGGPGHGLQYAVHGPDSQLQPHQYFSLVLFAGLRGARCCNICGSVMS